MVRVAVTGAGGRVGQHVLESLATAHDVTPVDRCDVEGWDTKIADVTDREAITGALGRQNCVVHLAAESASDATWEAVRKPNVQGAWNVYRAAIANDVNRVVFASSNHVTHMYNVGDPAEPRSQLRPKVAQPVAPDDPPRPTGPYGITKVVGEAIGSYHADRFGVEVVNLRIGWVLSEEALRDQQSSALAAYARAMWLSPRDCRDGVRKAVTAPLLENPLTVHLLSKNRERYLSIAKTLRALDYHPRDDSSEIVDR